MSNTSTQWVLQFIDEITSPIKEVQAQVSALSDEFADAKQSSEEYKKETVDLAQEAIKAHQDISREMLKEAEELETLVKWIEQYGSGFSKFTRDQLDMKYIEPAINKLKDLQKELEAVNEEMKKQGVTLPDIKDKTDEATNSFGELFKQMDTFNFAGVNMGFGGITKQIKGMTTAAWGFVKTPLGATIAGLAGITAVTKAFADYNKEAKQFNFVTEQITGLSGRAVDDARVRAKVIEDVYGKNFKDTLTTAQNLVNHFDISMDEAMDHISEGLLRGGHANDSFMKSFGRYGQLFNDAGYNVNEFRRIVNTGIDMGIYENKLPEAIKMFNKNIREQSGATQKAMENALGKKFTDKLFSQVRDGSITPKAALASIADEAERIGVNIQQSQELSSKLFGRAGVDAGGFENIIKAVNAALNKQEEAYDGATAAMARAQDRAERLAKSKDKAFNSAEMKDLMEGWAEVWTAIGVEFNLFIDSWTKGWHTIWKTAKQYGAVAQVLSLKPWAINEAKDAWNEIEKEYADAKQAFDDDYVKKNHKDGTAETNEAWERLVKNASATLETLSESALKNYLNREESKDPTERDTALIEALKRKLDPDYAQKAITGATSTTGGTTGGSTLQNDFGISGISGSGGGKVITMNLDIKNFFEVAKNAQADIEEIAEKIIGRVNDRLRDAVITLN